MHACVHAQASQVWGVGRSLVLLHMMATILLLLFVDDDDDDDDDTGDVIAVNKLLQPQSAGVGVSGNKYLLATQRRCK